MPGAPGPVTEPVRLRLGIVEEVVELTCEQCVAADAAMLLDLGRAEDLAALIAAQSFGPPDSVVDAGRAETPSARRGLMSNPASLARTPSHKTATSIG